MPELAEIIKKKEERKEITATAELRLIGATRVQISNLERDIYLTSKY